VLTPFRTTVSSTGLTLVQTVVFKVRAAEPWFFRQLHLGASHALRRHNEIGKHDFRKF